MCQFVKLTLMLVACIILVPPAQSTTSPQHGRQVAFHTAVMASLPEEAYKIATEGLANAAPGTERASWLMKSAYASLMKDESREASQAYLKACKIFKDFRSRTPLDECLTGYGLSLLFLERTDEAISVLNEAKPNGRARAALIKNTALGLIEAHEDRKNYQQALTHFREANRIILLAPTQGDPLVAYFLTLGMIKTALAVDDSTPKQSRKDILAALSVAKSYLSKDVRLVELNSQAALGLSMEDEAHKDIALSTLEVARLHYEEVAAEAYDAIEHLSFAGFEDEASLAQWQWQAFLEKSFGRDSLEAAEGLARLASLLINNGRERQDLAADKLFPRIQSIFDLSERSHDDPVYIRLKRLLESRPHPLATVPDPEQAEQQVAAQQATNGVSAPGGGEAVSSANSTCESFCAISYRHCVAIGLERSYCRPQYDTCVKPCDEDQKSISSPIGRVGRDDQKDKSPTDGDLDRNKSAMAALQRESSEAFSTMRANPNQRDMQVFIDLINKINKAGQVEPSMRTKYDALREQVIDDSIQFYLSNKLELGWRYRSLVGYKAAILKKRQGVNEALRYLDQKVALFAPGPQHLQSGDRLAKAYADLLTAYTGVVGLDYKDVSEDDRKAFVSRLHHGWKELSAISSTIKKAVNLVDDDTGVQDLAEAMIKYGETFESIEEESAAHSVYAEIRRIIGDKRESFSYQHIYDSVAEGLARTSGAAKVSGEGSRGEDNKALKRAVTVRSKIQRAVGNSAKQSEADEGAISFFEQTANQKYYLEFSKAAVVYGVADLKDRMGRIVLGPSAAIRERQQRLRDAIERLIEAIKATAGERQLGETDLATVFDALQWLDAGRAGDALRRAAARTVVPALSKYARQYDQAYIIWSRTQRELLEAEARSTGESSYVSDLVSRLGDAYKSAQSSRLMLAQDKKFQSSTKFVGLSLPEIQSVIAPNEAVIRFIRASRSSYALLVEKKRVSFFELSGLNDDGRSIDDLLESISQRRQDIELAHHLYTSMFEPLNIPARIKQLTLIPDDALVKIPFSALVVEAQEGRIKWLAERFSLKLVPSFSSLFALRSMSVRDKSDAAFIGFADPVIEEANCHAVSAWAAEQPVSDLCPEEETGRIVSALGRAVGGKTEILTGDQFSLDNIIRRTSGSIGIVAFATHAFRTEETKMRFGTDLPAILVRVSRATPMDQQVLTTDIIETLSINADLVILAACNTDAGEQDAEALSGLARAFFEAGARGVLVSRWKIDAAEASNFFQELAKYPGGLTPERLPLALQAAMIVRKEVSPAKDWAMFTYVGR